MTILALEVIYLIIDHILESELQHFQHVFAPSTPSTVYQLIITHSSFRDYLQQQDRFQQLRLWRLLNRIPRQFEPVQVAVGTMDCFTVLSIDMSTEKITNIPYSTALDIDNDPNVTETFLVLQESTSSIRSYRAHNDLLIYTKSSSGSYGWGSQRKPIIETTTTSGCSGGFLKGKNKDKKIKKTDDDLGDIMGDTDNDSQKNEWNKVVALFPLSTFIRHVQWYALHHDASVWLWKMSARFFRGSNLDVLQQQQFRSILDTPRRALIAWDRPFRGNFRFTESVLNSNVELFSKLLPST
ncbi:uncharacterized protein BX664DRAFT_323404 [Halteromyces radiatus]|uniref:uncharacterized protein n=1 Tax=Halteromyces radiatus TaxID=101107 RepID=UPI0022208638|nr:uncharacterized protein BX664DRAFT_323404 [Halteromyces radiatus]KAI8096217.1 hypothetical protein BX664DRAFT_323404 [Halteromyces radiatus]